MKEELKLQHFVVRLPRVNLPCLSCTHRLSHHAHFHGELAADLYSSSSYYYRYHSSSYYYYHSTTATAITTTTKIKSF